MSIRSGRMNREQYLSIYIALGTADPRYATRALATLRLSMISELGETIQKEVVGEGNSISIQTDLNNIPHRILNGYLSYIVIESGLEISHLNKIHHLLYDIFIPSIPDINKSKELIANIVERCNEYLKSQDYSNARIASNTLLAYALSANERDLAIKSMQNTLFALTLWPGVKQDRGYELEGNEWILKNIDHLLTIVQRAKQRFDKEY